MVIEMTNLMCSEDSMATAALNPSPEAAPRRVYMLKYDISKDYFAQE